MFFSPPYFSYLALVVVDFEGLVDGDCAPAALSVPFFRSEQPMPVELRRHVADFIKDHRLFFPTITDDELTLIQTPGEYMLEEFLRASAIALNCPIIEHKVFYSFS